MKTALLVAGPRAIQYIIILLFCFDVIKTAAQETVSITLHEAVDLGTRDHPALNARRNYLNASQALVKDSHNEYLPNVIVSAQQNYGTINGQYGPMAPVGALGVASAGPAYLQQNWNAAFGAAYIVSANWDAFTFGRLKSRILASESQARRDSADLEQEQFVRKVKIASAYFNLLTARQLLTSSESNLRRVQIIQQSVKARTLSGLNAGVDSSLVKAEVSRARLSLIESVDMVQVAQQKLADLLNVSADVSFTLDSIYKVALPHMDATASSTEENPQLRFFGRRTEYARQMSEVHKKSVMPALTLFGVYQARASGFSTSYDPETSSGYSLEYWDGVNPSRYNYVAGVSLVWNLLSPLKVRQQVHAQKFIAAGYQSEYDQLNRELQNQVILSEQRLGNSLQSAQEAPIQFNAASQAYLQKSVLYRNGLTTIVDLQQALYTLNRAEIDQRVAFINVWHALLMKAAATGDFDSFINQAR